MKLRFSSVTVGYIWRDRAIIHIRARNKRNKTMASGLCRCSMPAREILWRHNGAASVHIVKVRTVNPGHVLRRPPARARNHNFFHAALAGASAGDMLLRGECNPWQANGTRRRRFMHRLAQKLKPVLWRPVGWGWGGRAVDVFQPGMGVQRL